MPVDNTQKPNPIYPINGITIGIGQAGVRYTNRNDITVFKVTGQTALVSTQNQFVAAPVQVAREHHQKSCPQFLLINTGNANAASGQDGIDRARQTCQALMDKAATKGLTDSTDITMVLPFSTGVIGEVLPSQKIIDSLDTVLDNLSADNWEQASVAIMTTDTTPKIASEKIELQTAGQTISYHATGISKGAGMIRPNMATMLAFVATDANIEATLLQKMLTQLTNQTFNKITIDGDTSTNDCCVLIATGTASDKCIDSEDDEHYLAVYQMLERIFLRLATLIVRDGEGASKFITVKVTGGKTSEDCAKVAYSVAHSPLVKTAFFASDPNWGRIVASVGNAGVAIDQNQVSVSIDEVNICQRGALASTYSEEQGAKAMMRDEITVHIDLGQGTASDTVYTCDLSHDYVSINADYRS